MAVTDPPSPTTTALVTPPVTPPKPSTWSDIFAQIDQWDMLDRFPILLTPTANEVLRTRRLCSPTVGHFFRANDDGIHMIHNIHVDSDDGFNGGTNQTWGLSGPGSVAATVSIATVQTVSHTFQCPAWSEMLNWADTWAVLPLAELDTGKQVAAPKDAASAKQRKHNTRRKKGSIVTTSNDEETTDPADDPADPSHLVPAHRPLLTAGDSIPVPGFLFADLLRVYETDPATLCIESIKSIRRRAALAGEDPLVSAADAAYVPQWLWFVATHDDQTAIPDLQIAQAFNKRADDWAGSVHENVFVGRAADQTGPTSSAGQAVVTPPDPQMWTNIANALALQATDRISSATAPNSESASKTAFNSLPLLTRRLILHASERDVDGSTRADPLESYSEILGLGNAAFVSQHLHHVLREQEGLDVYLPAGFCTAVKTAAFVSLLSERPGPFSLFCCAQQPVDLGSSGERDEDAIDADALMRWQLKLTDSTTGLNDKDVKSLTKVRYYAPKDFRELSVLLENTAGVTTLVFGGQSLTTRMLRKWVSFLTTSGPVVAQLRQMAHNDPTSPSRLGWFIERRMQEFFRNCSSVGHADDVDPSIFDFATTRRDLTDGVFPFPLCPYLKAKLAPKGSAQGSGKGAAVLKRGGGVADDVVLNLQTVTFKRRHQDHWPTFLENVHMAPLPWMCCRYHLNGKCVSNCRNSDSHTPLSTEQAAAMPTWIAKCRSLMPKSGEPAAKKPKVANDVMAYPLLPSTFIPPFHTLDPVIANQPSRQQRSLSVSPVIDDPPMLPHRRLPLARVPHVAGSASPVSTAPAVPSQLGTATGGAVSSSSSTLVSLNFPIVPAHSLLDRPSPQSKSITVPVPRLFPTVSECSTFPPLPLGRLHLMLPQILGTVGRPTFPSVFQFRLSPAAAVHNMSVLRSHSFDLAQAFAAQPFSTLTIGSEFREPSLLAPLLSSHPLWRRFHDCIALGASFPLHPIDDAARLADVTANLSRGNHKSARSHEAKLVSMLSEEVEKGWQLPLPHRAPLLIPGAEVAPLGMVNQTTVHEDGTKCDKSRLTHDQSFNVTKGARRSVNDRVDFERLTPSRFGRAFARFLHHVSFLRWKHPHKRILVTKVDCKSAYRRVHLRLDTAVKSMTTIAGVSLLALRMTFGGAPNPALWSDISEVITDLANDLVRRPDWDPTALHSPHQGLLESDRAVDCDAGLIQPDDGFSPAFEMSVPYPDDDEDVRFDCYLDDMFGAFLESRSPKSAAAVPLALHLVSRPAAVSGSESFPRDDFLAISKFLAEALPTESKTILGWIINTRAFTVSLPVDKHKAWSQSLSDLLGRATPRVSREEIERLIGRLNHAAYVIPLSRHFLDRLYDALRRAKIAGCVRLNEPQLEDLRLWKKFLDKAADGLPIHRLVSRMPTRIVRVDACPQGIGGYGLNSGVAWRFLLPPELIGRGTLNSLEFLAAYVGVVMEFESGPSWGDEQVLLSQGDSTSATGWIAKSNFGDANPVQQVIARRLAHFLMDHSVHHYAQWFPGKSNLVADSLSRDFDLSDSELIHSLCSRFPSQVPTAFRIVPLPSEVVSFIGAALRRVPIAQQLPSRPTPSTTETGQSISAFSTPSSIEVMSSSRESAREPGSKSSEVSLRPSVKTKCRATVAELHDQALDCGRALFEPPSIVWLRPSGMTNLRVPSTKSPAGSTPFWPAS
jgi:hypothetical protein